MAENMAQPPTRRRLEQGARRFFERTLLALSLVVGLSVVVGCGGCLMIGSGGDFSDVTALIAAVTLAIGVVYLYVSMSRDTRILRQQLLERQERAVLPDRPGEDAP
jgi:hypothetical protein